MTRESLGYVKLEWTCPKCGSRNPGPEKTCLSCGAPQPENVQFEQSEHQELVVDRSEIEKAKAGADIHCAFCGARNPAGSVECSQCGADLKAGTQRETGQVVGAFKAGSARQIPCPRCGSMNPENVMKCANCGAPTSKAVPAAVPAPERVSAAKKPNRLPVILIGVLAVVCVVAIVVFAVLSASTEGHNGVVQSVQWTTSLTIEALQPVSHQGWLDSIPQDAQIGTCTERVHHVQDQPDPNATNNKICGTPYTVDKGSGFAEVVQDCQYEVLLDYCEYSVMEWQPDEELELQGNDFSLIWPSPQQLASDQRLGAQSQAFQVVFQTAEGRQYIYSPEDFQEFQAYQIGSEWVLNINTFDKVVSVEPLR